MGFLLTVKASVKMTSEKPDTLSLLTASVESEGLFLYLRAKKKKCQYFPWLNLTDTTFIIL